MLALITGASSGLGVEFARLLAMNGYDLIISARRKDRLNSLKKVLEKMYKVSVESFPADLSRISEVNRLAEHCYKNNIDVLINNAGFGILRAFNNISDKENSELINTNITALTILSREFIKTQEKGYILNVASIAAFLPGPLLSTYYASKAYVLSLSAAINEELKHRRKESCLQDSPPAAGRASDIFISAAVRSLGELLFNSKFRRNLLLNKKAISVTTLCPGPMRTEFFATAGASKEFATATPRNCAKRGLKAMFKRKSVVFSDNLIALAALGTKFLPFNLLTKISYKVQRSKFM